MSRRRKKPIPKPASRQLPGPTEHRSLFWLHGVVLLVLLVGNLALYYRTTRLDFLSVDDPDYVQNNPYIESFSANNLEHILTTPYAANYAPVNLLSYSVDVAVGKGKKASLIHLSSALWHGFVCCMVYALAFTIRGEILFAAGAALLFALHPAHVEAVAWISSRKDLVATAFAVPAMTFYLVWRRNARDRERDDSVEGTPSPRPSPPGEGDLFGSSR